MPEAPAPGGAGIPKTRRLSFYGSGGSLFGIHVVNILLTLVTLGIYYFWAKVRVRAYLLSQTEFESDRFAFHGTGKELLIGWLKALLVFGVPIAILANGPGLMGAGPAIQVGAILLVYAIVLVFIPLAMVGVRRYRLSRTSWREIRFSFRGRAAEFIRLYVGGWLLSAVTFGVYYPFFVVKRHAFMVSHSYFGNERFRFDGRGDDLFAIYGLAVLAWMLGLGAAGVAALLVVLVLSLLLPLSPPEQIAWGVGFAVALGLAASVVAWVWFDARRQRYFWDHTSFGTARFHSTVTAGALLRLSLGNLLLLVGTLGLAWPWVTVRSVRFAFRYLTLEGPLDLAAIQQDAQVVTATGEGLAGFLDAGFDLG